MAAYRALAPRHRAKQLTPVFQRIADELIEAWDGDKIDLVERYAVPYAVTALGAYFGLPPAEWGAYERLRRGALRPNPDSTLGPATAQMRAWTGLLRFRQVAANELADRRQQPRDDVLTALAQAAANGPDITDADILRIVPRLAFNATLGVSDLLGATLWRLLACPHLVRAVGDDLTLIPALIEETLRLEAPVQGVRRFAAANTQLGDNLLPAGSSLIVGLAAANRDPAVFPDPDRFALHRANIRDHLGFGLGHEYCAGAPLARRAVAVAVEAVLRRRPDARLIPGHPIQHWPTPLNRGLQHLWAAPDE